MKTILMILTLTVAASAQGVTFLEANAHKHQTLTTIEGTWAGSQVVEVPGGDSRYMLGNVFTVKSGDRLVQFYRWFKADDAPFLSDVFGTKLPVRVTYDPDCGYALAIEIIQPKPKQPIYQPFPTAPVPVSDWRVTVDYFPLRIERIQRIKSQ